VHADSPFLLVELQQSVKVKQGLFDFSGRIHICESLRELSVCEIRGIVCKDNPGIWAIQALVLTCIRKSTQQIFDDIKPSKALVICFNECPLRSLIVRAGKHFIPICIPSLFIANTTKRICHCHSPLWATEKIPDSQSLDRKTIPLGLLPTVMNFVTVFKAISMTDTVPADWLDMYPVFPSAENAIAWAPAPVINSPSFKSEVVE